MTRQTQSTLPLDRNENLYGPAPKCLEVLRNITVNELCLYSRDYARGIKSQLSERLAADMRIPESQVLLSEGSEDMLKQAVHCYLAPGEKILCPEQSWWYYRAVATEVGGVTVTYRMKQEGNRFSYDVGGIIESYRKESPRVVLIASPNNPTGNSFPETDLERFMGAIRDCVVILDEAYWGFAEHSADRVSELIARHPNLLILRTFSKFYALAGARIAYAAAGTGLSRLKRFASRYLGYNRVSERLALAALDSPDYYGTIHRQMCADRNRYYELFEGWNGVTCFQSDANFILVSFPRGTKEAVRLYLLQKGIAVKSFPELEFEDYLRLTLGTSEHNKAVITAMRALMKSQSLPNTIA